jgi:hypothetical protein
MSELLTNPRVGRGKRIWAIILGALAATMVIGSVDPVAVGGLMWAAVFGVGAGLLWRAGKKDADIARRLELGRLQLPVLELAREDGRVTVTEVATRLGWTMDRAAAVLAALDDGVRVSCTLTDEGVMVYEFRELIHDPDRARLSPEETTPLSAPPRAEPGR